MRPFPRFLTSRLMVVPLLAVALIVPRAVAVGSGNSSVGVTVVRAASWSPADAVREGAGEFEVMLMVAQAQREHPHVGIVGVGNRHGLFVKGAEQALRYFALKGVPVAKVSQGGDLVSDPDGLFLDTSGLSEADSSAILAKCLERYGTPPEVADPDHPTQQELKLIREHLIPFQRAFKVAGGRLLASR